MSTSRHHKWTPEEEAAWLARVDSILSEHDKSPSEASAPPTIESQVHKPVSTSDLATETP